MERTVVELHDGVMASDADVRERAADQVTDVHRGLAPEQGEKLVAALVAAAAREVVPAAQEAQLHALVELQAWHEFDEVLLRPLSILRGRLPSGYADYLEDLVPSAAK